MQFTSYAFALVGDERHALPVRLLTVHHGLGEKSEFLEEP